MLFIFIIMASIGLHEYGHYYYARKFGAKVTQFMLGFGPTLFSTRRGEVEYGVKMVPFGGFVRILGMYPPPAAGEGDGERYTGFKRLAFEAKQQSQEETVDCAERAFTRLPVTKRIIVMAAGPIMNLFLATIFFTILIVMVGQPTVSTTIETPVVCVPTVTSVGDTPACVPTVAKQVGLQSGDTLMGVGSIPILVWEDLAPALEKNAGNTVIRFIRDGESKTVPIVLAPVDYPVTRPDGTFTGETVNRFFLGVTPSVVNETKPVTSVPNYMWNLTTQSFNALIRMPERIIELADAMITNKERNVESPISVVGASRLGGEIAATDNPVNTKLAGFLMLAGSLNLFLFMFNLLPLLPLDGGHIAAAMFEGVRRRVAILRHRPDPGPADITKLLPLTYMVAGMFILVGLVTILADIVKPLTLG